MTPIKTYSVWFNGALAVLGAVGAAVTYLAEQKTSIPAHVLAEIVAGIGALTVFLRHLPQSEPAKKEPVQ